MLVVVADADRYCGLTVLYSEFAGVFTLLVVLLVRVLLLLLLLLLVLGCCISAAASARFLHVSGYECLLGSPRFRPVGL